jgi:hypothetical protein
VKSRDATATSRMEIVNTKPDNKTETGFAESARFSAAC